MLKYLAFLALFVSTTSYADFKCSVDLNFGLVVTDRQIRVLDKGRTIYQINDQQQLLVKGEWLELDETQNQHLTDFAEGLHYLVPKMITLATEGVALAVGTVDRVYVGLVGQDNDSYEKLQRSLMRVQNRVREKFIQAGDHYYMGPGSLENVDEFVDRELEAQIEAAINTSVGGVLSAIGGLNSGGNQETEAQMDELSQRIEQMGLEIERKVGPSTDSLRHKAQWFCKKMNQLNKIENELRFSLPELLPYDVVFVPGESLPEELIVGKDVH